MSTPKVIRATRHLLQQVSRFAQGLTKRFVSWLLRNLLLLSRPSLSRAGFVLPTTVLLLLVVVLTVGAISYRTFTRTQQAITERQQQVVYNAATPVIDRAKSKLEFLFDPEKDSRGGGVPSQTQLLGMMLNDERPLEGGVRVPHFPPGTPLTVDPYTFANEERIDVNGDGQRDNAWRYRVDLNGDGNVNSPGNVDGWAVYSIIFSAPRSSDTLRDSRTTAWRTRANALQVRNAPLSNASQVNNICQRAEGTTSATPLINGEGWFPDQTNTTKIRKNFQVNAYVVPDNPSGTVATLEFQQDREATQGFKWAAWFRNDLEIFPGPRFNWNGAMHTEGNLIVGGGSSFRGYLVSSPQSCINSKDASEVTARQNEANAETGVPDFKGRFITGTIRDNDFSGTPVFDVPIATGGDPIGMAAAADSVEPGSLRPIDFSLEPVVLQTEGRSRPRNPVVLSTTNNAAGWTAGRLNDNGNGRIRNIPDISTPYLDDTYRADNRWGPKPTWGRDQLPIGVTDPSTASGGPTVKIGDPIVGIPALAQTDLSPGADSEGVGLDGYWERRARLDGMRLIVGQRLELGDPAGWGGPGGAPGSEAPINVQAEPLRPWPRGCSGTDCNMERQRRSQWDNLAAVQATAIYHNSTDTTPDQRDFPDACLISTAHPGTPGTLDRSATFENLAYGLPASAIPGYTNQSNPTIITDVFRGRGTNGWEFSTPNLADFRNTSSNLMIALRNLAYFAGDPLGGTPSFRPSQIAGQQVHPYPSMGMWGDFSNLRQVFKLLDGGTSYDSLSPADKTTLHTAACTLGMLAYNLDYLEKLKVYDPNPANDPTLNGTLPRTLVGFTDTEVATAAGTGTTLDLTNTATLARPEYSQGLRGRIRLIDHIARGYIRTTNATSIPVALRPPDGFITNIQGLNTAGNPAMDFMAWSPTGSNNPETYIRLMERWRDDVNTSAAQKDELNQLISFAQLIITKEQVARDRTWGFRGAYGGNTLSGHIEGFVSTWPLGDCGVVINGTNTPAGGWRLQPKTGFRARNLNTNLLEEYSIPGQPINPAQPDPFSRLCSERPRYPILYSLFPAKLTNAVAIPATATIDSLYQSGGAINHGDLADPTEQGVRDSQDRTARIARYIVTENADANYQVVRPSAIALQPLTLNQSGVTLGGTRAWSLPAGPGTPGTGSTPNNNRFNLIKVCRTRCSQPENVNATFQRPVNGTLVRVAFKDGSFFNGREMLPVRTLDLDLDLMKRTTYGGDLWLPRRGIIYAFREDAVSEGTLVRPNGANTWPQCNTDAELNSATCAMRTGDVSAFDSIDPPINAANFITSKPVDYYPDPDRRPYGFRLRQGANLRRDGDEGRGLSFISDNPVYIQGNFNLHQDASGNLLEEFTQRLAYNGDGSYSNFYTRTELDLSFADRDDDQWRPSEVIADAVTLISDNFCDGSIEDGFSNLGSGTLPTWLQNRYGCTGSTTVSSYLNQNRPQTAVTNDATRQRAVTWVRANVADSFPGAQRPQTSGRNVDEGESPILISPLGRPVQWNDLAGTNAFYAGTYVATSANKPLMNALNNTRMNLIMVSGLVPSRVGQSYGGLHNFPRFLEDWGGQNLFISGAFLQLNFSNYATAPFDQEGWQFGSPAPATGAGGSEWIRYYAPPNRRWGYDVGLQYAPAGPVAQRFQFAEDTRSEFYSEPPANDPYISNLCRQVPGRAASCPAP